MHEPNWKDGARSAEIWRSSLARYAMPRLGAKRISDIETADVMAVLLPIWAGKRETAKRVRQRIGTVMKWAVAQGYRPDNPAGDAIGAALPKNGAAKKHHRALPHSEVAEAIGTVRASGAHWATVAARGLPMSDNTLSKLLREQGIDAVVHGFRSSFRNWAAECSDAPREVCELALAHVNPDRVEAAYLRSDLFAKRRALMEAWANYLDSGADSEVQPG